MNGTTDDPRGPRDTDPSGAGRPPSRAGGPGNLVVITRAGETRTIRRGLFRLVRLRPSGFRNVLIGKIEAAEPFLEAVAERLERSPFLRRALSRLLPLDRVFVTDPARFDRQLAAELPFFVDALAGRRFHVRVTRRGHKGVLHSLDIERTLGERVLEATRERGAPALVRFDDVEAVLAVEIVGDTAGATVVTRERWQRYPFLRID